MVSTIVALDLGTTHIRGIEAEIKNGKPPKIKKIYSVPIESEIISAGEIKSVEGLAKAIKKLFDEAKFKSKFVVSMAGGDSIENRVIETLWSPDEDYKRMLHHYIKESILADDVDDYYFDAHTLAEYFKAPEVADAFGAEAAMPIRMKSVLIAGVKKEFVDKFVSAVESIGLRPYALDIMPMAIIRAQAMTQDIPENASLVSVEVGGDVTTIVIHKNFQPQYIDTASFFGGLRVTDAIAQTLGLTLAEAELLKISFSVPQENRNDLKTYNYFEGGRTEEVLYTRFTSVQKEQAALIVSREVSNIITHVGDILEDAFSTQDTPFRIVLSGGGAGLHTLLNRLQTELGIPTQIIQPFTGLENGIPQEYLANQHVYASLFGVLVGQDEIK